MKIYHEIKLTDIEKLRKHSSPANEINMLITLMFLITLQYDENDCNKSQLIIIN